MHVSLLSARSHQGGAARAAVRLLRALRGHGVQATLHTPCIDSPESGVKAIGRWPTATHARMRLALDQYPRWLRGHAGTDQFTTGLGPAPVGLERAFDAADLLHLHWIGKGTLPLRRLARLSLPVVWTLHDQWPITGGCHYDAGCGRFAYGCGSCPVLGSTRATDLSARLFQMKRSAYRDIDLSFIAPSRWLADQVRAAPLGRDHPVHLIPNALDRTVFSPGTDRAAARRALRLPATARVVAFSAMGGTQEPRKGFDLLQDALRQLATTLPHADTHLLVIGGTVTAAADLPLPARGTGHIEDEPALARVLAAADLLVAPSRQDNLPNTVLEALACGVPAVAFDIGGMPDLIEHQRSGYLAQPFDAADLAAGIAWVLGDDDRHRALCLAARDSTERYAPASIAARHVGLYEALLTRPRR